MNQLIVTTICCAGQGAVIEQVDNHLFVIEQNQNYTPLVVSVLIHTTGGGEWGSYLRGHAYLKLWSIRGAIIQRGGWGGLI